MARRFRRGLQASVRRIRFSFSCLALAVRSIEPASANPATNFAPAVLAAGPVAYWRLNEVNGTTAKDWVAGHDGTNHNLALGMAGMIPPPTFVGLITNALAYRFNGSNSYVQTPLRVAGKEATFMALVNPDGTQVSAAAICVGRGSGANVCALDMQNDGVDLQYVWANDPGTWTFDPGFAPPPNQWSFVAIAVGPSNIVMYLDAGAGLMAATNTYAHGSVSEAGPIALGGDPIFGNRYFNGGIAEVAVFDRALTPGEIAGIAGFACTSNVAPKVESTIAFEPVHYRPLPVTTGNLDTNCLLLDGAWVLNPAPVGEAFPQPFTDPGWKSFHVPGQWKQQGFDVSQEQPVAMARRFFIPETWSGYRIILRFDAIHAGTTYWLNGTRLGDSENLFTPVEWDITDTAKPGQTNRLDLLMKVNTLSERLSYSSGYAFHNLGGIDRSVRVFALPRTCIRQLHLNAGLDANYRDGVLQSDLVLDSGAALATNVSVALQLRDAEGQPVWAVSGDETCPPRAPISLRPVQPFTGTNAVSLVTKLAAPRPWSAEKPNLYRLVLELRQGDAVLERIERQLGFRTVEVRNRQLHVNGRRIKVAAACHHETDPLTGRADTMRHAETDVRLLKEANLNYIRTSHYPPNAELLEAADRLGMYVEVEAPFCWVGNLANTPTNLAAVLTPTSAMVDYDHSHPSVIVWSVANESTFNNAFRRSTRLIKELDPTRPTTFNNPGGRGVTDIANLHYPAYPYDAGDSGDPRPIYLGEYFFEITHEQTDVRINPGLRELWGQGQAEPNSAFARALIPGFEKPPIKPGLRPGGWSYIYHSDHLLGGSIWASHDDAFYFSATEHAGYAWHHGFWGLIDSWRRPKPEWYLARHIFSPVWLQTRHPAFVVGQRSIVVPVENRYSFTDLGEVRFHWACDGQQGQVQTSLGPGLAGALIIPVPADAKSGDKLQLRVTTASGALVAEAMLWLGAEKPEALPRPASGAPTWTDDGNKIVVSGIGFGIVFNRAKGDLDPSDPRHVCPVISFPALHVTRYDFGDLNGPKSPPYAVFPEAQSRCLDGIELRQQATGLLVTVRNHYANFAGWTSWLIDKNGRGLVSCDYIYSGAPMDTREAGIRFLLRPECDQVRWRRWSEWGDFPEESISRTTGSVRAHRDARWGPAVWNQRPAWPWALDEAEMGTADFRAVKFNVYEAALVAGDGAGLSLHADADAHFRAALVGNGVAAHLLWRCPLAQISLTPGEHLQGQFVVQLLHSDNR